MNVVIDASLAVIEADHSIQCRADINVATVNEYAEAMTEGARFDPIELFESNGRYWIGDGWHRIGAARQIGALTIPARIHPGGRVEALKHALHANIAHGNRRTNADKRRCVEIALREFPGESSHTIAGMCGVGHQLVLHAKQVDESSTSRTVTGADGKQYPARRATKALDVKHSGIDGPFPSKHYAAAARSVGMIDDYEPKHDPAAMPKKQTPPCNGMHFANIALINLKQIRGDDIERDAAFSMIRRFIDDKQTAAH